MANPTQTSPPSRAGRLHAVADPDCPKRVYCARILEDVCPRFLYVRRRTGAFTLNIYRPLPAAEVRLPG